MTSPFLRDLNQTLTISEADVACEYIEIEDMDAFGHVEFELPLASERSIGYDIDLDGIEELRVGDQVTCDYTVAISNAADTEFSVTAEIVEGTTPTGWVTGRSGVAVAVVVALLLAVGGFVLLRR